MKAEGAGARPGGPRGARVYHRGPRDALGADRTRVDDRGARPAGGRLGVPRQRRARRRPHHGQRAPAAGPGRPVGRDAPAGRLNPHSATRCAPADRGGPLGPGRHSALSSRRCHAGAGSEGPRGPGGSRGDTRSRTCAGTDARRRIPASKTRAACDGSCRYLFCCSERSLRVAATSWVQDVIPPPRVVKSSYAAYHATAASRKGSPGSRRPFVLIRGGAIRESTVRISLNAILCAMPSLLGDYASIVLPDEVNELAHTGCERSHPFGPGLRDKGVDDSLPAIE